MLQDAWRDYDVAAMLAKSYKRMFKALFFLQIFLSYLAIVASTLSEYLLRMGLGGTDAEQLVHVVFFLSLAVSLLVSFDALVQSKSKWRQLRSSAHSLESLIWCYRTRVGRFEIHEARLH